VNGQHAVVFVVDDDSAVRKALSTLLRSVGLGVQLFSSAEEFLDNLPNEWPSCLVVDVRLGGMSGLDLQQTLIEARIEIPIIFITGHGDIPITLRALESGALKFLTKPFRAQELLDAVEFALAQNRNQRPRVTENQPASNTPRSS
jgi:FixJ family two-component response regulator